MALTSEVCLIYRRRASPGSRPFRTTSTFHIHLKVGGVVSGPAPAWRRVTRRPRSKPLTPNMPDYWKNHFLGICYRYRIEYLQSLRRARTQAERIVTSLLNNFGGISDESMASACARFRNAYGRRRHGGARQVL